MSPAFVVKGGIPTAAILRGAGLGTLQKPIKGRWLRRGGMLGCVTRRAGWERKGIRLRIAKRTDGELIEKAGGVADPEKGNRSYHGLDAESISRDLKTIR